MGKGEGAGDGGGESDYGQGWSVDIIGDCCYDPLMGGKHDKLRFNGDFNSK